MEMESARGGPFRYQIESKTLEVRKLQAPVDTRLPILMIVAKQIPLSWRAPIFERLGVCYVIGRVKYSVEERAAAA